MLPVKTLQLEVSEEKERMQRLMMMETLNCQPKGQNQPRHRLNQLMLKSLHRQRVSKVMSKWC